ncbi:MAG: class I SAM-dependent methyltransferase [Methylobacterium radiotolerans]
MLDVGCGHGGFRAYVPDATYTGLDPNFSAEDPTGAILDETVEAHAARVGPVYDVACAFQVIEHVADPLGFARALAACVKPGGVVLIGTPLWPSPNTTVPNFVINAPPHHLTWVDAQSPGGAGRDARLHARGPSTPSAWTGMIR